MTILKDLDANNLYFVHLNIFKNRISDTFIKLERVSLIRKIELS